MISYADSAKKASASGNRANPIVTKTKASKKKQGKAAKRPRETDLSRKSPNQDRAKRTVAKILAGAGAILEKDGVSKLTMRNIAATAGVSIGITYDYFPSKQAVLYRLYEARLKERLDFFDEAFSAKAATRGFSEAFERYLELQRKAGFPSRLDLELQNAIERDDELARMTRHYEDELSRRYVEILHRYGSDWPEDRLTQLAKFAHQLDHTNLKLQRQARPGNRSFYGELTTELFYWIVEYCGADAGR